MSYIGTNKLGKIFLGTTAIGKAYLGTDLVFQTGPSLPAGYTRLQYVGTDSRAYVDTGVAGAKDLEVSVKWYAGTYVQYGAVYGNYMDESHKVNRAILNGTTTLFVAGGDNLAMSVGGSSIGAVHTLTVTKTVATLDGRDTNIAASSQQDNTTNICLGSRMANPPTFRDIGLRIYSFSIKKAGELVINYIPCKRDSDSVAGFYDMVSESFVPSSTSTPFTAGPAF